MPKGIPKIPRVVPGGETQRLLAAMAEIEDRLAEMRRKDKARAALVAFAHKHGLGAADLRDAAKLVGAREVGDHPVLSKNAPAKMARGQRLKEARQAKGLKGADINRQLGVSNNAMTQWEAGGRPADPKTRAKLAKLLDLPKDFWDAPKANGSVSP